MCTAPGTTTIDKIVNPGTVQQFVATAARLTESIVMHNVYRALKLLTTIRSMSVRLAIDDLGIGYSSLA